MSFIKPQLASPMKPDFSIDDNAWVVEEKYDGHRICSTVKGQKVEAWSRNELPRIMPPQVRDALALLPDGTYDGELISTEKTKSYGVTELVQSDKLCLVVFDILRVGNNDAMDRPYCYRRKLLEETFNGTLARDGVKIATSRRILSLADALRSAKQVWDRKGEGVILKNIHQPYTPGKRVKHWIKIKEQHTAVLKIVGFIAGLLGPFSVVLLEDKEGFQCSVKTLNTKERANFEKHGAAKFLGRELRIEYQERTPDGGYRHPMWDRWEDQ